MSESRKPRPDAHSDADAKLLARVRAAARQEQFLEVVSADEARARFERHLDRLGSARRSENLLGSPHEAIVEPERSQ